MYFPTSVLASCFSLMLLSSQSVASPLASSLDHGNANRAKPAAFFLAGDSTTAPQAANGGGWGAGFLNTTLKNGAIGTNYGRNGRTTASFRAEGTWDQVLTAVKNNKSKYDPVVTIQFGHNDQKPANNVSYTQFVNDLVVMVSEVKSAGGRPILLTPLSRRSFSGGKVVKNLVDMRDGTIEAVKKSKSDWADLNERSEKYLNAIGEENAHTYNLNPDDNTHLNVQGSLVFGNLVSGLIVEAVPALKQYTSPDASILEKINEGQYVWP